MLRDKYVRAGLGVVLEFYFNRLYFDEVVVNKGCCLFGNFGAKFNFITLAGSASEFTL